MRKDEENGQNDISRFFLSSVILRSLYIYILSPKALVLQCALCIIFPLNEISVSQLFIVMEVYFVTFQPSWILENWDSALLLFFFFQLFSPFANSLTFQFCAQSPAETS